MGQNSMLLNVALLLGLAAGPATAQDPAKVNPKIIEIEIENNWVRVLRVKEGPQEKMPMHDHPATVAVYLTDVHQKVTGADGTVQEVRHKAGDVAYREAVRHADENVSDRPLEVILVELKPGAPRAQRAPDAPDPVRVDPQHHQVPIENERVRVLRTILEPHLKGPMHGHPSYVVVYLTELHTAMTLANGKTVDNPRKPGEVAWRDAYQHQTVNVGDQTAVEIQIELK